VGYSENVIWISDSESYATNAGCVDTIDPTEREDFTMSNAKDSRESQPLMHIHNLYADENGETHFRDINIEPATDGPVGKVSGHFPATGVVFRTTDGSYNYGWHTAAIRD
jgi:hypothetical protein